MSDYVQKLDMKRSDYPKKIAVTGFGERKCTYEGMGRNVGNVYKNFKEVVCVEACRTPYGVVGGKLKEYDAPQLGALAIKEVLRRTNGKVKPEDVDYVYMGQVVPAGNGQIPGRQATILAGLPEAVPCISVNKVCSSGIKTVDLGVQAIMLGKADIVIAGGQESMSNCPYSLPKMRSGQRMGLLNTPCVDLMVYDGLWDAFYDRHMAIHGSETSDEFGFTRQDNDDWGYLSQMRAVDAMSAGRLDDEIFPVEINRGKEVFDKDQGPRPQTTMEGLQKLPPVFNHKSTVTGQPGSVTAGNAPGVNDGGDVCLLMSREKADELGCNYFLKYKGGAMAGNDPTVMGIGPIPAVRKLLERTGINIDEIDVFEINEAFASQSLVCLRELGIETNAPFNKTNLWGGALALGHPLGQSGARLIVTLMNIMQTEKPEAKYGLAALCGGFGNANASLWERIK